MIKLVVFLGNPGKEYEKTRHNAGFIVCDSLFSSASWQKKFHGLYAQERYRLLKPQTYMNVSGISVGEASAFFHLLPEEIMVVHDDLELPFGKVRLQQGGGLQGHNGLRSIKEALGSDQFVRIRIGIGRPAYGGGVARYVLSPFSGDEQIGLSLLIPKIRIFFDDPKTSPREISLD
ncbi:MAG: aminoacyl-tRNA hydrolase [Sphaerochaetaceae bacterium]|jgi:PTH1 family peptidyl-tRNA hydrolase